MSILYGLDVKFAHQREIKGGGDGQELAPERERARAAGRRPPSDISHWWPLLASQSQSTPIKILATLWRTSRLSLSMGGRIKFKFITDQRSRSFIQGGSHWPFYLIEGVTVHLRLEWSKSEVILRNLSSSANLGFVLKEIHFLVCFAQQFYWRGDKVQGRGKAQLTMG